MHESLHQRCGLKEDWADWTFENLQLCTAVFCVFYQSREDKSVRSLTTNGPGRLLILDLGNTGVLFPYSQYKARVMKKSKCDSRDRKLANFDYKEQTLYFSELNHEIPFPSPPPLHPPSSSFSSSFSFFLN